MPGRSRWRQRRRNRAHSFERFTTGRRAAGRPRLLAERWPCPSRVVPCRATLSGGNSGGRVKPWPASLVKMSFWKLGRSRDRISRSRSGAQRPQRGSISSRLILLRLAVSRKWWKGRKKVSGERYKGPPRVTISPRRRTTSTRKPSTSLWARRAKNQTKPRRSGH